MLNELQYLLQDIKTEQPGPGDDAALACLVSSQNEVGRSQHLGLSQLGFGFLVAGEKWGNRGRQAAFCSENHKSGTHSAPAHSSLLYLYWIFLWTSFCTTLSETWQLVFM